MADWPFTITPGLAGHLSRYTPVKPIRNTGPDHIILAQETDPSRPVAIKLLQYDASADPETWSRRSQFLVRSGVTLARLRHPNIVEVYDFGASPDGVLLVMEYLEGGSLDQKLATFGMLEALDLIPIARDAARALDYIHEGGLVHCDIRPGRIAMDAEGKSRLLGFSSARSPGATSVGGGVSLPASVIYAAPEQLAGNIVPATDQFSLAAVIYRALTGRRPFRATELVTLIRQILTETPAPPSRVRPGLPQGVDAVLARALAKNPDDRFRDCSQFADAFEDAFGMGSGRWWSRVDPAKVGNWVRKVWAG